MNPPDWQNCIEETLWKYVAWHLEESGIQSVLVGGAVVSIYTEGLYRSGDLDLIPDDMGRPRLDKVLAEIGYRPFAKSPYRNGIGSGFGFVPLCGKDFTVPA